MVFGLRLQAGATLKTKNAGRNEFEAGIAGDNGGVRQSRPIKPSGRANHSARVVTRAMWRKSAGALNFETLREVEKLGHREARNFGLIVGVSTGKSRLGDLFG